MRIQGEGGCLQTGEDPSEEINLAGPLIADFKPPELGESKFLFPKPPCPSYPVRVVRADQYTILYWDSFSQ